MQRTGSRKMKRGEISPLGGGTQFCARFGCFLVDARQCARKDAKNKHGADTTIILFFYYCSFI